MTLDEALSGRTTVADGSSAALASFEGDIQPDHESEFFRLYPNPNRKNIYYLILKSEASDIYKWTTEELSANGLVGQSRYRINLRHGTLVHLVSITQHRVGEGKKATQKVGSRVQASDDCTCLGPDSGCSPDAPCADDCDNCSSCCIA